MWCFFAIVGVWLVDGFGLPEQMHGTWKPSMVPGAILGPQHYVQNFMAVKEHSARGHHASWFQFIIGQEFMVSSTTNEMQYCFSTPLPVSETAPFYQHYVDETKIDFCWRGEPMPTHKAGCQACDCAKITLELKSADVLHATFWMSPPVIHLHAEFTRHGPPPLISELKFFLGGKKCTYSNRTGLLPYLQPQAPSTSGAFSALSMCPSVQKIHKQQPRLREEATGVQNCRRLDGINHLMDSRNVPNIRFQYKKPRLACWPCDVQYSVSANVDDDQYFGVGFKGMGYAIAFNDKKIRPNYFGMSHDDVDDGKGGSAMVVGHGTCFREMKVLGYTGAPIDLDSGEPHQIKLGSTERISGRIILRFTMKQYVGRTPIEIDDFFADPAQGSVRVMWAIGDVVNEEDCSAALKYHNLVRGVAPLRWLSINSVGCDYSKYEMDRKGPAPPPTPPGPPPSPLPFWPTPPPTPAGEDWVCSVCSHTYDPDADGKGAAFEDLPDTWLCPICGQPKSVYEKQSKVLLL